MGKHDHRSPVTPAPTSPSLKKRLIVASILIIAVSISSFIVLAQLTKVASPETVFVPHFITIPNPIRLNETMYAAVNLEAEGSIAAQKQITPYIRLAPNHQLRHDEGLGYASLPENYTIVFIGTFCPQEDDDKYDQQNACGVIVKKKAVEDRKNNPDGFNYEGTGKIEYPVGGQFAIMLATNFNTTQGTMDIVGSDSAFINIVSLEDSQQAEYSRAAVLLALPLAVIAAAISLIPVLIPRK